MRNWTAAEWIEIAGVIAGVLGVVAALYARRPTRAAARTNAAAARSEARRVDISFGTIGAGAKGAPGFHDGLKLQVHNRSTEHVLAVAVWADRDSKPGPWWLASDGLGPDESAELRLPEAWPCEVHVYYLDHLERAWRRRVNGHGVGDVEQVDARDWPTIEPRRRRWWRLTPRQRPGPAEAAPGPTCLTGARIRTGGRRCPSVAAPPQRALGVVNDPPPGR